MKNTNKMLYSATICREMAVLFEPAHIADEMPILDVSFFISNRNF